MSQIIAGTYELGEQIGSGGGGVVYLGRHLRLDKPVVLKADKRTLSAKPETLRREVDALKNISHTYIPQVYDFVAEDGVVYTVMDYIEGESLDKPLKRGERFPQPQVIKWARQLLEALCYLHSRPPHGILHSDIKPANIMLTPQGDIRLIDFNIALALGEEGTVRVGYSRGYASPEHYGADRTYRGAQSAEATQTTEALSPAPRRPSGGGSSSASGRGMTLDARSDLYSLGATLYHLLTGVRPAQDAAQVVPITGPGVSPAVAAIIGKAMDPDPDRRYQSAQEMLEAFQSLHENDPRAKRHKRRCAVTAAALCAVFLTGGLCTFLGLRQMEREQAAAAAQARQAEEEARLAEEEARLAEEAERTAKQALTAIGQSEEAYRGGDLTLAASKALEALKLDSPYAARAQKALTDALGVYDLSDGFKAHGLIPLPSEPLDLRVSPNGACAAVMTLGELLVFDVESGTQLTALPAVPSALAEMAFAGEDVILFAGADGLCAYDLSRGQALWTGQPATGLALSGDGSAVAAIFKDEDHAAVYDVRTGALRRMVSFAGNRQNVSGDRMLDLKRDMFALDEDGTHLAVSFSDGSLWICDLENPARDLTVFDGSEGGKEFWGGFCGDGLAIASNLNGQYYFGVVNVEEAAWAANFPASSTLYRVSAENGGLYLSLDNILVRLDLARGEQIPAGYTDKSITAFVSSGAYTAAASQDGAVSFFAANDNPESDAVLLGRIDREACDFIGLGGEYAVLADRNTPALQVLRLETHDQSVLARYDPQTVHREARISADGNTVMLFQREHFSLFDTSGLLLAEADIPDVDQIYDQQFRREGTDSWLEVIYFDGLVRSYSAADGRLLSERQGEPPDETMYEELFTDRWRIASELHGPPTVYDRETGEELGQLLSEDYLTYATQAGDFVVTEYINTQGERYGLLLNGERETLAYLPGLCDVTPDGVLVFDDMLGNLRQSRIYSAQELMALAQDN